MTVIIVPRDESDRLRCTIHTTMVGTRCRRVSFLLRILSGARAAVTVCYSFFHLPRRVGRCVLYFTRLRVLFGCRKRRVGRFSARTRVVRTSVVPLLSTQNTSVIMPHVFDQIDVENVP